MQIDVIAPERFHGQIVLPASKSISNRALVIHALSGGRQLIENVSDCDDTWVMLRWLNGERQGEKDGVPVIDIGAAGTAMRFSSALLAVRDGECIITGTERMKHRPIGILVDALRTLGAQVDYVESEGFPPLHIVGNPRMAGGEVHLPGSVSSQYISALLMVGPMLERGLRLVLEGTIVSRPYIKMTIGIMRRFGAQVKWEPNHRSIVVAPGGYKAIPFVVENDWSAASYWYEMVALSHDEQAEVVLPGLFTKSWQGDSGGAAVFERLGVRTDYVDGQMILHKGRERVDHLEYDFVKMPDLAQTFVVTCCMLGIPFHFTGLQSLKIKETDRIEALKKELAKLGFFLQDRNDSELLWDGVHQLVDPAGPVDLAIDTYEDHRMAMAFAPAALRNGKIRINHPEVVSKSYPGFWKDLQHAGFDVKEIDL